MANLDCPDHKLEKLKNLTRLDPNNNRAKLKAMKDGTAESLYPKKFLKEG